MKPMILFFSFLLILSCIACNRPQPAPQATTARLTLTMSPLGNKGLGPLGNGAITLTPSPKSGNANCKLVGNRPITCVEEFAPGATVVLSVTPDRSSLESINGCNVTKCVGCAPGVTTCQVIMNGDQAVSAVFIGLIQ